MSEPFVERMKEELTELKAKTDALSAFLITSKFDALTEQEKSLLTEQESIMQEYCVVLAARIALYP